MSSIGVAEATSAKPAAVPVVLRELLHTGPVVEFRIGKDARRGLYDQDGLQISYLQSSRVVKGGRVNCFIHTDEDDRIGKTIRAEASVWRKVLEDGRTFLYLDLKPVSWGTPVTHRLVIVESEGFAVPEEGDPIVFETPDPIQGLIAFVSPDMKLSDPAAKKAPAATGDGQLDRLLSTGWAIESEDAKTVTLWRMKGDQRRTMVHQRQKPRGKKSPR